MCVCGWVRDSEDHNTTLISTNMRQIKHSYLLCSFHILQVIFKLPPGSVYMHVSIINRQCGLLKTGELLDLRGQEPLTKVVRRFIEFEQEVDRFCHYSGAGLWVI